MPQQMYETSFNDQGKLRGLFRIHPGVHNKRMHSRHGREDHKNRQKQRS